MHRGLETQLSIELMPSERRYQNWVKSSFPPDFSVVVSEEFLKRIALKRGAPCWAHVGHGRARAPRGKHSARPSCSDREGWRRHPALLQPCQHLLGLTPGALGPDLPKDTLTPFLPLLHRQWLGLMMPSCSDSSLLPG